MVVVGGFVVVVGEGVVIWFHQVLTNRMMLYSTHVFYWSRKMARTLVITIRDWNLRSPSI